MDVLEKMKLDEIDTRLYEALQLDGRASMEELAQRVGLSRIAARARVARLLESGSMLVTGIVHPSALGKRSFAHLSIHVASAARDVGRVLVDMPDVPLVSIVAGQAALICEVHAHDVDELRQLVGAISITRGVRYVETAVYTERIKDLYAPPRIVVTTEIDDTDRRILDLLRLDGRASFAALARATEFSSSAVRARVHRLIDAGVVRISTVMAPGAVGLQHMCGFGVRLRADSRAVDDIASMDAVSYLSLTLSRWDAIGTVMAKSQAEVVREMDRLRALCGVEELQSWTHLEILKENDQRTEFKSARVA